MTRPFVGERLLARRSSRWTRRVAESLWAKAHAYKTKRAEKRALRKAPELPSQALLTDQRKTARYRNAKARDQKRWLTLHYEKQAGGIVAGIDEVGRGPWAGPVVAAAVIIAPNKLPDELANEIDDSKKLSAKKREAVAAHLPSCAEIGIGAATPAEIGKLNILGATFLAMERAVRALPTAPQFALVDGNRLPALPCPARTIVKGDSISLSIAAASIVAKVTRDSIMTKLSLRYPALWLGDQFRIRHATTH